MTHRSDPLHIILGTLLNDDWTKNHEWARHQAPSLKDQVMGFCHTLFMRMEMSRMPMCKTFLPSHMS